MSIKAYRPITPAQRQKTTQDFDQITTRKPLKSLTRSKKQSAGRNNSGRITVRHRGGGVVNRSPIGIAAIGLIGQAITTFILHVGQLNLCNGDG